MQGVSPAKAEWKHGRWPGRYQFTMTQMRISKLNGGGDAVKRAPVRHPLVGTSGGGRRLRSLERNVALRRLQNRGRSLARQQSTAPRESDCDHIASSARRWVQTNAVAGNSRQSSANSEKLTSSRSTMASGDRSRATEVRSSSRLCVVATR